MTAAAKDVPEHEDILLTPRLLHVINLQHSYDMQRLGEVVRNMRNRLEEGDSTVKVRRYFEQRIIDLPASTHQLIRAVPPFRGIFGHIAAGFSDEDFCSLIKYLAGVWP